MATARERARAELTREIKESARRQIADAGASSLSLRAVSRELGMVSSALYRYFPSRDALLTALIVDAFDAVGEVAEDVERRLGPARGFSARWVALGGAVRGWAVANPHDYALVYGSPVPGYEAPRDTVDPAARVSLVALRLVADGVVAGEVDPTVERSMPRATHGELAALRAGVGLAIPDEVLARTLLAWSAVLGAISYELFGHLHGIVADHEAYFGHQLERTARLIAAP
ncbi:MAG TPA: TetR/AcrR family transcriptional regulator [Acidimicrobiales bacterium]|nr:TetR/AcrR family transcriptional regulator [Acidimicrobiales bacterium]